MAFELYAHVCVPNFSTDAAGKPSHVHPVSEHRRILVGTYVSKLLAQWWGINMKRVYIDTGPDQRFIATERQIMMYELVDIG